MSHTVIFTSLHGRKFGLSSSGGLLVWPTTGTGYNHFAEISSAGVFNSSISSFGSTIGEAEFSKLKSVVETISSSAATLAVNGISRISSDVINVSVLKVPAPETGIIKIIFGDSSASTISFNTTSSDVQFVSTAANSSALVWDKAGGVRGDLVFMAGLSTTRWAVLYKTAVA